MNTVALRDLPGWSQAVADAQEDPVGAAVEGWVWVMVGHVMIPTTVPRATKYMAIEMAHWLDRHVRKSSVRMRAVSTRGAS